MERSPVGDWQELSALYEEADGLDAAGCAALLDRLKREQHPQAAALEQMLRARDRVRSDAFLDRLPSLPSFAPPRPGEGSVAPGDHFGPYSIVRRLGAGGMAQVWLAERDDGAFQRHVAIKLPYRHAEGAQRETLVQRFARERDILAALHHPNIAALHDAGVTPAGQPWLALEMVEGEAITDWCDRQRLPVRERVRLFRQVLRAVQHAHANLVIHRDLKPANILVTPQGNVRLLDFGIAKLIEPLDGRSTDSELTREGGTPLTLQYASPEQITGLPLTTACDVYALGVVLYELLAGVRPYEPKIDSAAQIEQAIVEHEPRAPSRRGPTPEILAARDADAAGLRRALAPDLDAIVLHALAKQPQGRYPSAEALLADLDRWLGGLPVNAQTPSALYRLRKFVARNRIAVSLGAVFVAALLVVTALALVMGLEARQESARAIAARDFLLDMFRQADPERTAGKELTARRLLDEGQDRAMKQLVSQPALQAELLRGIGQIRGFMSDYAKAEEALNEAIRIYRRAGRRDELSWSLVELADNSLRMGNYAAADRLLNEAEVLAGTLKSDHAFQARFHWVRGWIANNRRDVASAKVAAEASLFHANLAFGAFDARTIDGMRLLADTLANLGQSDPALMLLDEAESRLRTHSLLSPRDRMSLHLERAGIEHAAGKLHDVVVHLQAALPDCEALLGARNEECDSMRHLLAVDSMLIGHVERTRPLLPQLLLGAQAVESPRRRSEAQILAYRMATRLGSGPDQAELELELQRLGQSGDDVAQPLDLKMRALLALAEGRLQAGDSAAASRWLTLVGQRLRGDAVSDSRVLARHRLFQGIVHQIEGKHAEALADFDRAQSAYASAYGIDHPMTTLFSLNRVPSLIAIGDLDGARAFVDRAEGKLQRVIGQTPAFEQIVRFRAGLSSRLGIDDRSLRFM